MNKSDLINEVAQNANITKAQAGDAVNAVFNAMSGVMKTSDKLLLTGFGTSSVQTKPVIEASKPAKGKTVQVPVKNASNFKASKIYTWSTNLDKVKIIRSGVPYDSIEVISKRINVPIKDVLHIFDLPQTTYNKKIREKSLLNGRDSEVVLLLIELFDFGVEVFNNEEKKFQNWIKKPNIALGGNTPESFLDSITGIQEVKFCLNRIEFGNFA